jgi:hypothetical protein
MHVVGEFVPYVLGALAVVFNNATVKRQLAKHRTQINQILSVATGIAHSGFLSQATPPMENPKPTPTVPNPVIVDLTEHDK